MGVVGGRERALAGHPARPSEFGRNGLPTRPQESAGVRVKKGDSLTADSQINGPPARRGEADLPATHVVTEISAGSRRAHSCLSIASCLPLQSYVSKYSTLTLAAPQSVDGSAHFMDSAE